MTNYYRVMSGRGSSLIDDCVRGPHRGRPTGLNREHDQMRGVECRINRHWSVVYLE